MRHKRCWDRGRLARTRQAVINPEIDRKVERSPFSSRPYRPSCSNRQIGSADTAIGSGFQSHLEHSGQRFPSQKPIALCLRDSIEHISPAGAPDGEANRRRSTRT
jgi:hypothetical protein